jgi:SAM-dependent methyltransferase
MASDTQHTVAFYATARGAVAGRLVRDRLGRIWPDLAGQSVLGVGYCAPYLRLWREQATRCVALTPAQAGIAAWPRGLPSLACAADEDALPFPDLFFNRVLLVHGLETAESTRRMLREIWRVLRDDGVLLVVAPNRNGMWAHVESTPFGHGQPYSSGQIDRLLGAAMFRVERRDTALYLPPVNVRMVLRTANLLERVGRRMLPRFAGVTITEAVKDMYAAVPAETVAQRRLVLADAA